MYLEIKLVEGIYKKSDLEKFNLTDLVLTNDSWNEVENAQYETIQDKLGVSSTISTLIPKQFKMLENLKTIGKFTSSFNKRAESLSFGKVGKLTGKYYTGDFSNSDLHYSDYEVIVRNKSADYDPINQKDLRERAEREFESILTKLLFMSMYKLNPTDENDTWDKRLTDYDENHLNKYLDTKNSSESLTDYFNEYIASELTNALLVLTNADNKLVDLGKQIAGHKVIKNLAKGISDNLVDIADKIKNSKTVAINPLKLQFAVYERRENNTKKFLVNHIDNVYSETGKGGIITQLNKRLNEFNIISLDIEFIGNFVEHTFHRAENPKVSIQTDEYKYPMDMSVMFPEAMKVKFQFKNNRKFTLNEWIKYYENISK